MKIKVPATSANLGCGFDSVGFAVNLYLELEILKPHDRWEIAHDLGEGIPRDESNLIISTALKAAPGLTPHKILVKSSIPLKRGLGSSSSAIVAGIELACEIGGISLSTQEKLLLACEMEGHPDNVAPAILRGLVISSYSNGALEYVTADMPNVGVIAYIPNYKVSTKEMRKVLPKEMSFNEAVYASSIGNVMVASLLKGDMSKAGRMMEQDRFHEKYRACLAPELKEVREIAHERGAYCAYLSGSGSTIITVAPIDRTDELTRVLSKKSGADVIKLTCVN